MVVVDTASSTARRADANHNGRERLLSVLLSASILSAVCIGLSFVLHVIAQSTSLLSIVWVSVGIHLVLGYVTLRCALAFIRLQCAPIYPRAAYYGKADVAPEPPERYRTERLWSFGAPGIVIATVGLATLLGAPPGTGPVAGVALGLLSASRKARTSLSVNGAELLELSLRQGYLLYLRSFGSSRTFAALLALRAAHPERLVMIVSPRRTESTVAFWYLVSVLLPGDFARIHLWSTTDAEWDRIVASCMAHSLGIVVDCAGLEPHSKDGLTIEAYVSSSFAKEHPTAYLLASGQTLPTRAFPGPALLRADGRWWTPHRLLRMTARVRAIARRRLPEREQRYLDDFYARSGQEFRDAMVSDRNLAAREGRKDPHELLMQRRDRSFVAEDD